MASFGSYESFREISTSPGAEVFSARHTSANDGKEYAVKVYSLDALIGDNSETRSDLDPVLLGLTRSFASRIEIQKKAAQASPNVAPVLENGRNSRGVWYATHSYPRTLQKIVLGHVSLSAEGLYHVVSSAVAGALSMKQTTGRPHGNLKLTNVLLSGAERIRHAEVVISDPLPGGPEDARRYELEDLHGVGRLIYQLVFRREIENADDWTLLLPLSAAPEWSAIFGKNANRWMSLCNRLLDPKLSLDAGGLERLAAELASLQPKPPVSAPMLVTLLALLLVCCVGGGIYFWLHGRTFLVVTVDPPASAFLLDGTVLKPGRMKIQPGMHTLVARYPGLDELSTNINIDKGQTLVFPLRLEYVNARVASDPAGAAIEAVISINGNEHKTNWPASGQAILSPRIRLKLTFSLPGYELLETNVALSETSEIVARLEHIPIAPPGAVEVTFTNLLLGATLTITSQSNPSFRHQESARANAWEDSLDAGVYDVSVAYPHLESARFPVAVKAGSGMTVEVPLKWAKITFNDDIGVVSINSPGNSWEETNPSGPLIWRPGRVTLNIKKEGYFATNVTVVLQPGGTVHVAPELVPATGFADVTSDPEHAEVFTATNGAWPTPASNFKLAPGFYTWRAHFDGLEDVTNSFSVAMGQTTNILFAFNYGTLDLTVSPSNTTVTRDGVSLNPPYHIIQKTGQIYAYSFSNLDYDPANFELVVGPKESANRRVELLPKIVSATFATDPPGGQISDENGRPIGNATNHLRWGLHSVSGRYEGLDPVATNIWVSRFDESNVNLTVRFQYGTVRFTSTPPGAKVFKGDQELGTTPADVFVSPSDATYRMDYEGQITNQLAKIQAGSLITLTAHFTNSNVILVPLPGSKQRLEMVKVKDQDFWVGKYDITQDQYESVTSTNPSYFNKARLGDAWAPKLPVENVYKDDAVNFCGLLTQKDADWLNHDPRLKGFEFTLPTTAEWESFLGNGKDTNLMYVRKDRTAPVGTMPPNTNGVYDAYGNVRQWLINGELAGLCWQSKVFHTGQDAIPGGTYGTPQSGFRVILKAAGTQAAAQKGL